jgi:hypothetical protein
MHQTRTCPQAQVQRGTSKHCVQYYGGIQVLHSPAGRAGTLRLTAAGSLLVAAGVCADWGGGVAGLAPPADARPPLLGVLLRFAAASTAPATAPPSPCNTTGQVAGSQPRKYTG